MRAIRATSGGRRAPTTPPRTSSASGGGPPETGADHGAARSDQALVAVPEELSERPIPAALERPHRDLRGVRGFSAVSQAVHDRDEPAGRGGQDQVTIAGLALTRLGELGDGPLDRRVDQRLHRRTVIVVPFP
jgi:hypothetical protein